MSRLDLFVLVAAIGNLVVVFEFVRRRRLLESFALLWMAVGAMGVLAALGRSALDRLASAVGISYGSNLILAAASGFLLFVCMSLSLHVSRLERRTEILAEEVAFLRGVREPSVPADDPEA